MAEPLTDSDEVLFRQIHPNCIYNGEPASDRFGTVMIFVCGRAVDHQADMALMKRSPKITANCAFAIVHSRG
ncbi:hypothetical protein, partial [Blastomonas sp.]|uniref:hypothetical protein n=1 Tax=Blastomonas sp. TaxID=1909299 RepID=UPI00391B03B8